jgi:hypothetical protein
MTGREAREGIAALTVGNGLQVQVFELDLNGCPDDRTTGRLQTTRNRGRRRRRSKGADDQVARPPLTIHSAHRRNRRPW